MEPLTILITGSAGFIGTHLTGRFLREGHTVIGVDNYLTGQKRNTAAFSTHPNFQFLEADISRGLPYHGPQLDWVLHFASPASPPHYQKHPIETLLVGAQGTQACLELARQHHAKFLLASTSEVYGDPLQHPQSEAYWGNVNPTGPRSCYDEAKRYAEALTMAHHRTHGTDTRVIRIFNTYGPRMRPDDGRVVTNFINQALTGQALTVYGDGSQTRSFQYIDDLTEGIARLMRVKHHEPLNLGDPHECSVLQFAQLIRDHINPALPIVFEPRPVDDPKQRRPDITRAVALLGWRPSTPLATGLTRTVNYFRELAPA